MLTLRENLLIRPWQERRYMNHRRKVENALPIIDNRPPAPRRHVSCKLKKFQKEKERCSQIISDNFTLLQHLSFITRTSRVDNTWEEPPPKVGIYRIKEYHELLDSDEDCKEEHERPKTRKGRCLGCNPHRYHRKEKIPEERVPFPPPKKRISSKSEEPSAPTVSMKITDSKSDSKETKKADKPTEEPPRNLPKKQKGGVRARSAISRETQSLELSRGNLTFRLRFPADSSLVFKDRGQEKVLQVHRCHCASLRRGRSP